MKKKAISSRISAARPVSVHLSSGSIARDRDDRSSTERSSRAMRLPASMAGLSGSSGPADRLAVALQAVDLGLRLGLHVVRQRRVLQLRRDLLALVQREAEPALDQLGLVRVHARLAHVLVDEQEGHGADRIGLVAVAVDRAEAQVVG